MIILGVCVIGKTADKKRDGFRSRWGFILACIGSAVGMGNIWRFPTLVSAWGGLTFIIPYLVFVVLIGSTGVMGWIFKYTFLALSGGLYGMGQDMDLIGGTFGATASAWGANLWIVIAVLASFLIMSFGVSQGIEKANKIMMPVLFFLFVVLGIYILTLPGAFDGYRYIFTLDPAGMLDPKLLVYAFGQAFFSLSVAGNGTVIYGSYLGKHEDIPGAARNVALFDTLAALLAAFVIIPAMAAVALVHAVGLGVALCIQAVVSQWMDVVSIYICPLGAALAAIMFFWVAGRDFVYAEVNRSARHPVGAWFYPLSKYVYVACAIIALTAGAALGGIG